MRAFEIGAFEIGACGAHLGQERQERQEEKQERQETQARGQLGRNTTQYR